MGIRFRKSINIGPLRINLSRSGIGTSVGVKGLRKTKTATGQKRTTVSVPGTGISYVTTEKGEKEMAKKKSKAGPIIGGIVALGVIGGILGGNSSKAETPSAEPTTAVVATTAATTATTAATQPEAKENTYIINTSSKKFHKPSCSSVDKIEDGNKEEYVGQRNDLIERGFSPCGNCNPQ